MTKLSAVERESLHRWCLQYRQKCREHIDNAGPRPTEDEDKKFLTYLAVLSKSDAPYKIRRRVYG